MSLSLQAFSVRYGSTVVLRDIDLSFRPGTLTALIGPNGSGKSSLLRAMAGLQPHGGTLTLDGRPPTANATREQIAYMPQDTGSASSLTLLEVVLLGRLRSLGISIPGALVDEASKALTDLGLGDLQGRTLDEVSGGQRQLAYLAQTLFRAPEVFLLDEPTSALDMRHQLIVLDRVRHYVTSAGVIGIAAMHDLTLAANATDNVACLCGGTVLAEGASADVLTRDLIAQAYRVDANVEALSDGKIAIVPSIAVE